MSRDFPSDAVIDASQFRSWQSFVDSETVNVSWSGYLVAKRLLDLGVAIFLLLFAFPVMAIAAVLIKLWDSGPIFFAQTRVGQGGRHFTCYKFRSMVANADELKEDLLKQNRHRDNRTFKMPQDPRTTWIGRILRKTSIDELPQLWNVVRGEMSLVGPRPPVPSEVDLYSERDRRRLDVQPGITCIWQVTGRGNLPFSEQVRLDVDYIERRNLLLDLKLLAMTIPAVVTGRGAIKLLVDERLHDPVSRAPDAGRAPL